MQIAEVTAPSLTGRAGGESVLLAFLLLAFTSCDRYDIELYTDGSAEVEINYDWMSRYGEMPEGMTLMLAHDDDLISYYDVTHNVGASKIRLKGGEYKLTVMNKTFGEYSTMTFGSRNSHDGIYAVSKTYYVTSEQIWDNGRVYLEEPEKIGVATDTFYVNSAIDSLVFFDYRDNVMAENIHLVRHDTILPMTTTLYVLVKVRGISYMRSMEGYITGMANGFNLNTQWRRKEVGTLKLDRWERDLTRAADDDETNVGWMRCSVETFGLPHGRELLKQRVPESNYIMLHFTLLDGRTKDFAYMVGKNIRYIGDDGSVEAFYQTDVALELNLVIDAPFYQNDEVPLMPYAQPEGSGQFDAQVADWGDDVDVDIPM